ncbi:hypothetical protein IMG5_013050, partial [Ichthyophthirius multifiliis]
MINQIEKVTHKKENLCWLCTILKFNNPFAFIFGISEKETQIAQKGLENIMSWFYVNKCFLWNLQRQEIQYE